MDLSFPLTLNLYGDVLVGLAVSLVLLLVAWKLRQITRSGVVAGVTIGTIVFSAYGWPGFVLLFSFFLISEMVSRHAIAVQTARRQAIGEDNEGMRTFSAIFVPGIIPALAGLVMIVSHEEANRFLSLLAFVAALTTALGDMVSTDLGQVYAKRTYQLITLERVRAGTRGGVSVEGSVYGGVTIVFFVIFAFTLFHLAGFSLREHDLYLGTKALVILISAAVIANHIESVASGVLGQFQRRPNKYALNLLGASVGALLAVFFTNLPEA